MQISSSCSALRNIALVRLRNIALVRLRNIVVALLLLTSGRVAAQTADQQIKAIPDQIKTNAATKATTKSNTVANNAMNKLDSASNKAFNGLTHMFKKKKRPVDSTKLHPTDTTAVPAKPTGMIGKKSPGEALAVVLPMTLPRVGYAEGYIRRRFQA